MDKKLSVIGDIYSEDVFVVLMDYEIARAKRYPAPIALLCIEIVPNASNPDTLQAASALFASALNKHMRSADIPCVNGKEFKVMLPSTNLNGLQATCERMLSIFKNKFETEDGNTITFSLNVGGSYHEGGESLSRSVLLENAQSALKQSKQKGLNTFVIVS
jgi:diguanylate cyclase (GGDEF)-like protein